MAAQDHQSEVVPVLLEWDGGSVGGNNGDGDSNGGNNVTGAVRALESSLGRYDYSPLKKVHGKEKSRGDATRDLQTETTLKVEFIDCKFTVSACTLFESTSIDKQFELTCMLLLYTRTAFAHQTAASASSIWEGMESMSVLLTVCSRTTITTLLAL